MKTAYLDCFSGISGDMTLSALIDAGASLARVQETLDEMGLGQVRLSIRDVMKRDFRASYLKIDHPPEHAHRHLSDIERLVSKANMDSRAADLAMRIFQRIAIAEGRVHGMPANQVHFHEVGAIDSIADIVGVSVAFTELQIERVVCSAVPTGTGQVKIAHGMVSIPAPATAELLRGIPIAPCAIRHELTTPTGAAIVAELAEEFGPVPNMSIEQIGYGAGTLDLQHRANLLRVLIGETESSSFKSRDSIKHNNVKSHDRFVSKKSKNEPTEALIHNSTTNLNSDMDLPQHHQSNTHSVSCIETNLDDETGETIGLVIELLDESGALDTTVQPIQMKKNRPGFLLSVLCDHAAVDTMADIILENTSSIGVRISERTRRILNRRDIEISTPWGIVRGKLTMRPSGRSTFKPEFDDCRQIAIDTGLTLDQIRAEINECFENGNPQATDANEHYDADRSDHSHDHSHDHDHHH